MKMIMTGKTQDAICECPICYEPINMGLMTQCGHSFCGDCILKVWKNSDGSATISCPLCRQKVRMIMIMMIMMMMMMIMIITIMIMMKVGVMKPCLSEEERSSRDAVVMKHRIRILAKMKKYNKYHKRELFMRKTEAYCQTRPQARPLFIFRRVPRGA